MVRDVLLECRTDDPEMDVAAVGADAGFAVALARELDGRVEASSQFGTARVDVSGVRVDVAMARRESYAHPGALPTVAPGSLEQDLARRDFTINALAVSVSDDTWGDVEDPHDGREDLERQLIRVLHPNSFVDDPTRIFRAVRYAGRLGFDIEPETRRLVQRDLDRIGALSGVRVRHELVRVFHEEAAVSILKQAGEMGVLAAVHPDLRSDVAVLAKFGQMSVEGSKEEDLVFIAGLTFSASSAARTEIASRLDMDARWTSTLREVGLIKDAFDGLGAPELGAGEVYRILRDYGPTSIEACALFAEDPVVEQRLRLFLDKLHEIRPLLRGDDLIKLGVPEGPTVGRLLEDLLIARIEGLVETREDEENMIRRSL